MADLLTHVLAAYVLLTAAGWLTRAVSSRWVAVGMAGAAVPDLYKISVLVPSKVVSNAVGHPFSYTPMSTLGGVVLLSGAVTLAFDRRHWRRTYAFLLAGGATSLVLDGLRTFADGRAETWLYPVTWWRPPTPNLYVSSDPRVAVVAVAVATLVFAIDRWVVGAGAWARAETEAGGPD